MIKTSKITLTDQERYLLKQYKQTSPLKLIRRKAETLLLLEEGTAMATICRLVDRSEYTVKTWLRDWRIRRLSSIFSGHMGNSNAGKLTKEQRDEIQQVLQSPPSDFGLSKDFWDVPQLKTYTDTNFDTVYARRRSRQSTTALAVGE